MLLGMLQPLLEFHRTREEATQEDLRLYWDVRIIKGSDQAFGSVAGSSTLSGILSDKMRHRAPGLLQVEINEKIAAPLSGVLEKEIERELLDRVKALDAVDLAKPSGMPELPENGGAFADARRREARLPDRAAKREN
jgi:hypothetical protein